MLLIQFCTTNGQEARLVYDFNPGEGNGLNNATILGSIGNSLVLKNGLEIWLSDGSTVGTNLIHELGEDDVIRYKKINIGEELFLSVVTEDLNQLVVISESEQTYNVLLEDDYISLLIAFQDKLYFDRNNSGNTSFNVYDPINKIDSKVYDLYTGGTRDIVIHNDMLYAIQWSATNEAPYLSKTDGTEGNIEDIYQFNNSIDFSNIRSINMTSAGDNIFFWYYGEDYNYSLYVSNGTSIGTYVLSTDFDEIDFFDYERFRAIESLGNKIFFNGLTRGETDKHLWESDGTIDGTKQIELEDGVNVDPRYFTKLGDKLYFRGNYTMGSFFGIGGAIVTDGNGYNLMVDPLTQEEGYDSDGWNLINHNDTLFFGAETDDFDFELYASLGTSESTVRVSDIAPGDDRSDIFNIVSAGDNLFFFGDTPETGVELFVYGPEIISSNKNHGEKQISIFPNPVEDFLSFDMNIEEGNLEIFNVDGTLALKTQISRSHMIDVSKLISGAYSILITSNGKIYNGKFIKK